MIKLKKIREKASALFGEDMLCDEAPLAPNYHVSSLQTILPYEQYDEARGIYFNRQSIGIMFESAPLLGCSEEMLSIIASFIREGLPTNSFLQILAFASPKIGKSLDTWRKQWEKRSEAHAILAAKRSAWLKSHASEPQYDGVLIRNFRIFWCVAISCHASEHETKVAELMQTRDLLKHNLAALNLPLCELKPTAFINLMQDVLHPNAVSSSSETAWNPRESLSQQCLDFTQSSEVYQKFILCKKSTLATNDETNNQEPWTLQTFIPVDYPKRPTQWEMGELIGDTFNESLRQPYPFLLSLTLQKLNPERMQAKTEASFLDRDGKMKGTAAKFIPRLKREHADWRFIRERLEDGEKLVKIAFQGVVFAPLSKYTEAASRFTALFTAKQWKLARPEKVQWPLFLASLPMFPAEGYFEDLGKLGMTRTVTSFNAANLLPLQGEMKGQTSGQLFLGRRGQLSFWDPFSYQGDNYNVAVAATSGVGKSTAIQDYIVNLLSNNGRAWVIDVGRNYLKSCQWLKGEFLEFGKESTIILNPFTKIATTDNGQITDDAFSLLKPLFGLMARPKGATTEEEDSFLEQAIQGAFADFGRDTRVTHVASWLKSQSHPIANNLATLLFPYTKQGMYARWFEGCSDLEFNNPFIVLELEELSLKPDLREVVLMLLMHHIHVAMYLSDRLQKKSCIIDEAWSLLQSNNINSAKFIENGYRRARRYHGNFITITQGLDDYYKNLTSKAALDCSGTLWLLKHKADSIQFLEREKKLPIDGFNAALFKSLHKGQTYSESLIINEEGTRICRLPLDPFSRILYSSKGEEFEAVKQLQNKGMSLLHAVEQVAARLRG